MDATQFPATVDRMAGAFETASLGNAMQHCYEYIVDGFREMFATESGPDGEIWPKRKDKATHPLLNKTGALLAAATGGAGHVKEVHDRSVTAGVEIGTQGSLAGAAVHQYGATIVPRNKPFLVFRVDGELVFAKQVVIPPRPFIGATSETLDNCRETISEHVLHEVFGQ